MVREIMRDEVFLARKAESAAPEDLSVAQDLLDTLAAHKDGCVGMAANMIGVNKRVIVFDNEGTYMVMFNPEIVKKSGPYQAERAVYPCPAPAGPGAGSPSKCSIRTRNSRPGSRPSLAGRPRSSSMRSTTAMASSFSVPVELGLTIPLQRQLG